MTGLPTPRLLDAAHIIPDTKANGVAAVQNGIALSKLHHTAYDRHLIGIDSDFKIHVSDEVMAETDGPLLEESIKGLNGRKLIVPSRKALHPNKEHLAARFEEFLKAN
jgi:putative restriction endonuclease